MGYLISPYSLGFVRDCLCICHFFGLRCFVCFFLLLNRCFFWTAFLLFSGCCCGPVPALDGLVNRRPSCNSLSPAPDSTPISPRENLTPMKWCRDTWRSSQMARPSKESYSVWKIQCFPIHFSDLQTQNDTFCISKNTKMWWSKSTTMLSHRNLIQWAWLPSGWASVHPGPSMSMPLMRTAHDDNCESQIAY